MLESCADCDVRLRSLGLTEVAAVPVAERELAEALLTFRQQLRDLGYTSCADEPLENGVARLLRFSRLEEPRQFLTAIIYPDCRDNGCDSESLVEVHLSTLNLKVVGLLLPKIPADMCR